MTLPEGDQEDVPAGASLTSTLKRRFPSLNRLNAYLHMGPRKKSKLDDKATASESENLNSADDTDPSSAQNTTDISSTTGSGSGSNTPRSSAPSIRDRAPKSWYGGSWRSKASPVVAEVARENVGVSRGSAQELPQEEPQKPTSTSPATLLSRRRASKGNPIAASMTMVHATSGGEDECKAGPSEEAVDAPESSTAEPPLPPNPTVQTEASADKGGSLEEEKTGDAASGNTNRYSAGMSMFKSWWSRPDGYEGKAEAIPKPKPQVPEEEARTTPLPGTTPVDENENDIAPTQENISSQQGTTSGSLDSQKAPGPEMTEKSQQPKSWFWSWTKAHNTPRDAPTSSNPLDTNQTEQSIVGNGKSVTGDPAQMESKVDEPQAKPQNDPAKPQADSTKLQPPASKPQATDKSTGWAFWSKDTPNSASDTDSVHKEVGELAVADTPSQSNPEAAQFNERDDAKRKEVGKEREKQKTKSRGKETLRKAATNAATKADNKSTAEESKADASVAVTQEPLFTKRTSNILLPDFNSTYQFAQSPSVWQKIRQYLLGGEAETPHLHLVPSPPRIKKALAIGVHGFFPSPLIRTMIGQPTGTSIRFSTYAANAISEWTQNHGGYTCDIEKIALEGEGFISERVDTLWKLLLNWIEHIRNADFIMIACHSQGVPVAIMLVAKLISFGCISPGARIGINCMAGINLGPFVEYRTRYFGNTAAELFEFSNPKSAQFINYLSALKDVLKFGVKLVYVGSLDDQLVSLESSTFANISHPYIYRAVFVDGKLHAPDFITHLIGFVLKLRNLGLPDHGLIHELSPALAGSLYTGEGHSRIHEDPRVYSLAVSHALETTNLPQDVPLVMKDFQGSTSSINPNPYFLPWAMRGLLEEEFVKRELGKEVDELLNMFEAWKPTSKALKDVRFRLEAVRSKL